MIIRNGLVWGDDFAFHEKDLYIDDVTHTIVDKPVSEHEEILDANGNYVIPGLCISMVQRVMISVTQIQTDFPILQLTCIPAVLHPSVQHP